MQPGFKVSQSTLLESETNARPNGWEVVFATVDDSPTAVRKHTYVAGEAVFDTSASMASEEGVVTVIVGDGLRDALDGLFGIVKLAGCIEQCAAANEEIWCPARLAEGQTVEQVQRCRADGVVTVVLVRRAWPSMPRPTLVVKK